MKTLTKELVWQTDCNDGTAWFCPDCDMFATIGGNMGYHIQQKGHGLPTRRRLRPHQVSNPLAYKYPALVMIYGREQADMIALVHNAAVMAASYVADGFARDHYPLPQQLTAKDIGAAIRDRLGMETTSEKPVVGSLVTTGRPGDRLYVVLETTEHLKAGQVCEVPGLYGFGGPWYREGDARATRTPSPANQEARVTEVTCYGKMIGLDNTIVVGHMDDFDTDSFHGLVI
jgi:hypothetical protein